MAQPQTWSEWFFGNTGQPTATALANGDNGETSAATPRGAVATPDSQSSSPYGPYVKTGRGGAGNYTWQADTVQRDLEAHKTATLPEQAQAAAEIEHEGTQAALRDQQARKATNSQYIRFGRGIVERKVLRSGVLSSDSETPTSAGAGEMPSHGTRKAYSGRGGAGNYAAAAVQMDQGESAQLEQQRKADKLSDEITKQVESALPPPQDVLLRGSKSIEMPGN